MVQWTGGCCLILQVAVSENCVRIDFCVLSWNKMAIDFYERLGAVDITKRENWHFFGILDEEIRKLVSCWCFLQFRTGYCNVQAAVEIVWN